MIVLLFSGLLALASARPDIGLGYNYKPPATSYGVPVNPVTSLNNNRQYYHVEQHQGSSAPNAPATSFVAPVFNAGRFGASVSGSLNDNSNPNHISTQFSGSVPANNNQRLLTSFGTSQTSSAPGFVHTQYPTSESGSAHNQGVNHFSGSITGTQHTTLPGGNVNVQYTGSSVQPGNLESRFNYDSNVNYQQSPEVTKHIYFFAAPEEPEEIKPRINLPPPAVKKNVKILVIKAPSYRTQSVQIPVQPQVEEKTKIYVLVKKPDDIEVSAVPAPGSSEPAKPEVYFVKYKTQQEAEEAISNAQGGAAVGNEASSLQGDQELISNIAREASASNVGSIYSRSGNEQAGPVSSVTTHYKSGSGSNSGSLSSGLTHHSSTSFSSSVPSRTIGHSYSSTEKSVVPTLNYYEHTSSGFPSSSGVNVQQHNSVDLNTNSLLDDRSGSVDFSIKHSGNHATSGSSTGFQTYGLPKVH